MTKNNATGTTAPKKPRIAKAVGPATKALLDALKTQSESIKAQLKNAKALGKILDAIAAFDAVTLAKVSEAVTARETVLSEAPVGATE